MLADLSGQTRAAVFLLSLPEERAVNILQHLEEKELLELRQAVEGLGPVSADLIDSVYMDFSKAFKSGLTSMHGSEGYLQDLVRKARGEEEAVRLFRPEKEAQGALPGVSAFSSLEEADPAILGVALANEHPQIAAAVLAYLDPKVAAKVLSNFSEVQQADVLRRISKLQGVPESAFADVQAVLAALDLGGGATAQGAIDGVNTAAALLNSMGSSSSDELLARLSEDFPEDVEAVRRAMFTFENLLDADQRGLQQLLREVQSDTLLTALKMASEELRTSIFGCMSSRAAEMLVEELELMPPTPRAEVESAQQQVVEIAMRLVSEGKITIAGQGEDMV